MALEAASRVAAALGMLAAGALLRAGGMIGEAEAGSTLATYLTLPCLALRVFSGGLAGNTFPPLPPLPLLAIAAATALLSALLAAALGAFVVFSGRRRPERALLTAAAVGSGGGLFTSNNDLSPAGCYGHALAFALAAGGEPALPFALSWCLADAAASLLSTRVLLGSWGGNAFPESYEHADGGLYSGEWGAPGRGRGGVGRASASSSSTSTSTSTSTSSAEAGATTTSTNTDAPASASKQGLGVYRYPSGARYEGQWHAGLKSGRGVYVFPKGGRYEGEWRDGVPDGIGVKVLSKKKNNTTSTSSLKAGFWRGGSFEGPLPLWQCADAASGARAAAKAARRLSLGGGGLAAAFESLCTQPLLWAVVVGSALRFFTEKQGVGLLASFGIEKAAAAASSSSSSFSVFLTSLLEVLTGAAASAHIPLSLLLSGAAALGVCMSPDGSSAPLRDAFNNADAALSLGLRAASAAAATAVVAAAAAAVSAAAASAPSTTTAAALSAAATSVLACSLSPAAIDLPRLAVRFRVNDAAAGAVAGWSAASAPVLAAAAVAALSLPSLPAGQSGLAAVAAVAAAACVVSVIVALAARGTALSAGRNAAFAAREAARAAEAEAGALGAGAKVATPSPSAAARAAARARAAAVAPRPGVGFAAVENEKEEEEKKKKKKKKTGTTKKQKGPPAFRDDGEEGGGSGSGSGGGAAKKPAAALPSSRPSRPQPFFPVVAPRPPRRRVAPLIRRRALHSPLPARFLIV